MRKLAERLLLLLLLAPAIAGAAGFQLYPFTATYSAALNGMPLGFELKIDLSAEAGGNWKIALNAGSAALRYEESSVFHWQDCRATPLAYRYEFRGFGIDRKLWLDFDHARNIATGESRRGPVSYELPPGATDDLSLSFAARCRLLEGERESSFPVATTTGIKDFRYRLDGRETIKTGVGRLETLRIVRVRDEGGKRQSTMWIAPSLDHMLVKVEHVEKFGVRGMVILKNLERHLPTGKLPADKPPADATALKPAAR